MKTVLKDIPDDRIRAYFVWLPVFGGDFRGESRKLSKAFPDPRVTYFSDPGSLTGSLWLHVLQTGTETAWDVYMLYGADAEWAQEPPMPDFWMHQLDGVTKAPLLNEEEFEHKLREMLKTVDKKTTSVELPRH
jgi:hypothetical protein